MGIDKLGHLIYASAAAPEIDASDLRSILQVARRNNSRLSITGMLLYSAGSFFQVLEGDEEVVKELFATISADSRHGKVVRIISEAIAQRAFGDWTMGFSEIEPAELAEIEGFNGFFRRGASLTDLQPGRAQKLLSAFAQGRWRARLEGSTH